MPQVTVYIRKEDLEAWKKVEKKAEFIHEALNPVIYSPAAELNKAQKRGVQQTATGTVYDTGLKARGGTYVRAPFPIEPVYDALDQSA